MYVFVNILLLNYTTNKKKLICYFLYNMEINAFVLTNVISVKS